MANLAWDQIPPEVIESVKLQIFDVIGVMLAARTEPLARKVFESLHEEDGPGETSVLGESRKTSLPSAAMINGVMAGMLEFDDTQRRFPAPSNWAHRGVN